MVQQLARVTTLTGTTEEVNSDEFTKAKAISKDLLDSQHSILYLCPFTASRAAVQRKHCEKAGLFAVDDDEFIVGMDLEYSGPRYPSKKKKGHVYDASVLILSTRKGTIVYNLFQYQDYNSDAVHFPNPFLPRVKNEEGKWVVGARGQSTHGVKWTLPSTLKDFFAQPNLVLTGRSVNSDMTRLNNVFFPRDDPRMLIAKTLDVSDLKVFEPFKSQRDRCQQQKKQFGNSLSDWYVPHPL